MDADSSNPNSSEWYALPQLIPETSAASDQRLRVVFGRVQLTRDRIQSLSAGQVIPLLESVNTSVDIMRGDSIVARAVPIQQGGKLAWRITELFDDQRKLKDEVPS